MLYYVAEEHKCIQRNLDLTNCQGTGEICSLYRTPPFNEFSGKLPKCPLYRGKVNTVKPLLSGHPLLVGH